ncbi:hypothetical protein RDI58_022366 [Solanum bulbocastanum]|uniref:Uncharacterized protein n=1 Tax=Solanum bulbocastanum TaxID=147425 RepID=A0AAN8T7U7_SOLBU
MMFNEEDQDMEDQVVPQMPLETTLSPMYHHATYQMIKELPNMPYHHTPILFLRNPLTLDMLQNSPKIFSYNHTNFEGETGNGWGEHNQARLKCEPVNVVDARRELQLAGRYNNKDVALEL